VFGNVDAVINLTCYTSQFSGPNRAFNQLSVCVCLYENLNYIWHVVDIDHV